jgi:hypothetical protein
MTAMPDYTFHITEGLRSKRFWESDMVSALFYTKVEFRSGSHFKAGCITDDYTCRPTHRFCSFTPRVE